jgi:hypothetical protein
MTARIKREFDFQTGVNFNGKFFVNYYNVTMYFNVETGSIFEQNIALERLKYFIREILDNCVFVNDEHLEIIQKYQEADLRLCTLPNDPYDQIIAIMLLYKANAIMEGRIVCTDISLTSALSDDVHCLHSVEENAGTFAENGWWNDSSPKYSISKQKNKRQKLFHLIKTVSTWEEVFLGWDQPTNAIEQSAEVVFVNFGKKTEL